MMRLSCFLALHNTFHTPVARRSLFVLKVPLNTKQPTYYVPMSVIFHVDIYLSVTTCVCVCVCYVKSEKCRESVQNGVSWLFVNFSSHYRYHSHHALY